MMKKTESGQNQLETHTSLLPDGFDTELLVYPICISDMQILISKQLKLKRDVTLHQELVKTDNCIALFQYGIPVGCISCATGYMMLCDKTYHSTEFFKMITEFGNFFMYEAQDFFNRNE